ncbi:MAG: DegT/DnrJ/EryC1/StrS family aminotransferase [Vicinamibacterales bacterium]
MPETHAALAIHGGPRVRPSRMPARLAFAEDAAVVRDVFELYAARGLDPGYQGEFERRYTDAFARWLGGGFADAVSTGSAALFVALAAMELPAGSHVLVSPVTDPGTISAIILNRLVPVLMDSAPGSCNTGFDQFIARVTPATRAVVVVHASGTAAEIDRIAPAGRERGLLVLEDCSQAHGARRAGRLAGTFGDLAAFSTMYRKAHATGGSGGVVFTRDETLFHRVRAHADRGKPSWRADFDEKDPRTFLGPALNFNLDEISCAIGERSLARLDRTIARRLAFVYALRDRLAASSRACAGTRTGPDDSPFYYPVRVDARRISCGKQAFAEAVRAEGIDLNPDYRYVVAEWPWARSYLAGDVSTPNAVAWRESHFNILLNERYGEQEVEDIAAAIAKVESVYARP